LLYFSRGQLEPSDWPDPAVDCAAAISNGEIKSAAVTATHWSKEVLRNFIRLDRSNHATPTVQSAIGL
jgi:hypothetical protein